MDYPYPNIKTLLKPRCFYHTTKRQNIPFIYLFFYMTMVCLYSYLRPIWFWRTVFH